MFFIPACDWYLDFSSRFIVMSQPAFSSLLCYDPLSLPSPLFFQLCYVSAEDFGRIRTQGEEDLKKVFDDQGQLVAVLEKRSVERKEGYFLIQVNIS